MDSLFSKLQNKEDSTTTTSTTHENPTKVDHQPSNSELMESAKYVAEAAKATLSNESDKVDKAKAAGAAEDLLSAASKYGKLEEKSYGKYVEKAEDYLHHYQSPNSKDTTTAGHPVQAGGHDDSSLPSAADEKSGDYMKMAEGFFKK